MIHDTSTVVTRRDVRFLISTTSLCRLARLVFKIESTGTGIYRKRMRGDVCEEFTPHMTHSFLHFILHSRFEDIYYPRDGDLLDHIDRVIDPQKAIKDRTRFVDFYHGERGGLVLGVDMHGLLPVCDCEHIRENWRCFSKEQFVYIEVDNIGGSKDDVSVLINIVEG